MELFIINYLAGQDLFIKHSIRKKSEAEVISGSFRVIDAWGGGDWAWEIKGNMFGYNVQQMKSL